MAGVFAVELARAVPLFPRVPVVVTAAFEHRRGGMLVDRVMPCSDEPASIAVAMPKGHRLAMLIRDSHSFAVNIIEPGDRLVAKKFDGASEADVFELMENRSIVTGSPCLARSVACLDCEVMRHFDLEADHEMYVGLVVGVWNPPDGEASVTPSGQYADWVAQSAVPARKTWSGGPQPLGAGVRAATLRGVGSVAAAFKRP
ncbi:MAG: flavin reductase family protein [Phycisphaerales bacterium]